MFEKMYPHLSPNHPIDNNLFADSFVYIILQSLKGGTILESGVSQLLPLTCTPLLPQQKRIYVRLSLSTSHLSTVVNCCRFHCLTVLVREKPLKVPGPSNPEGFADVLTPQFWDPLVKSSHAKMQQCGMQRLEIR